MRTLIGITLACLCCTAAAGDVYRWVDSKGVVHYSDKPQSNTDTPAELPHLQTYSHTATPPGFAPAPAPASSKAAAASSGGGIAITSPQPDETIRDAEGKFTVTVAADLGPDQGLVYYLDGTAENPQPTPSTAFLYARVERGEHTVAAALVAANGKELERTPAVTIHVMPPIAKR